LVINRDPNTGDYEDELQHISLLCVEKMQCGFGGLAAAAEARNEINGVADKLRKLA
jgi:hypothetical protein